MIGDAWTDAGIEALIRGLDQDDWRARCADIHRDMPGWINAGQITEDQAERLTAAIQAREDRTREAAADKVEHRTAWDRKQGRRVATGGRLDRIVGAIVGQSRLAPRLSWSSPTIQIVADASLPPDRPRRGPPRTKRSPAERFAHRRRCRAWDRRRQAKMAKIPAALWQAYTGAEAAALSIIVYDCAETAAARCTRPYKHIAASASVCVRSVAEAVAVASYRGDIAVEHRKGTSSIITLRDPTLIEWVALLDERRHPHLPKEEKIEINQKDIESPLGHARSCMTPSDRCDDEPVDGPPEPPATLPAAKPSRPSGANVAHPSGVAASEPTAGPLDAHFARLDAVVADHSRSSEYRRAIEGMPPTTTS